MTFIAPQIPALATDLESALRAKMDNKTKPLGSLGRLEALAIRLGLMQGTLSPALRQPAVVVFAGDHGLTAEGVSPFPSEVTAQMVLNFLRGGAAINVLARQHHLPVKVVDAGVASELPPHPELWVRKVRAGTRNALREEALTEAEVEQCLMHGIQIARDLAAQGTNAVLPGEMGIGNSSAAALLFSALQGLPLAECVGRGAGHDTPGFLKKLQVLRAVQERHGDAATGPLGALRCFGGCEIAMIAGFMLGAAEQRMLVVVDGFIASSAALVAAQLAPAALDYFVFSHLSAESGHVHALRTLEVKPLLDLGLRLGEGTGAVLAWPLVVSAVKLLEEMATFESAGVSGKAQTEPAPSK